MKDRAAKLLTAAFASVAAAAALTAIPHTAAIAAAECLSGPKGQAPQGSHWYYRTDHANNRNCWYVRQASAKTEPAAANASAEPPAPQPAPALQRSVANARAEFTTLDPAPPNNANAQPAPALPSNAAASGGAQGADPQTGAGQNWPLASRWSNPGDADASSSSNNQSRSDAQQPSQRLAQVDPAPAATPDTPEAVVQASAPAGNPISMLVVALAAALALAGLIVGAIVKFGGSRPSVRRDSNGRPDIWGPRMSEPDPADRPTEPPMNWVRIARERHAAQDRANEIEQLLERAPRRPAT